MKKSIFAILGAGILLFSACGGEKKEDVVEVKREVPAELKGMLELDLGSRGGFPLLVYIPDTGKTQLEIITEDWGETKIICGPTYKMQLAEGGDLALRKQDIIDDLLYKGTIIEENEHGILYKQEIDGASVAPAFHFYAVINFGGIDYEIQDVNDGEAMDEKSIKRMFIAAKSMVATPA